MREMRGIRRRADELAHKKIPGVRVRRRRFFRATNLTGSFQNDDHANDEKNRESLSRCRSESDSRNELNGLRYFLAAAVAGAGAAGGAKVHGGTVSAVGVTCNGVRLFLLSSALKSAKSLDCIVFHAVTVVLYSLQSATQVSISA